jgi:hypothetical protein
MSDQPKEMTATEAWERKQAALEARAETDTDEDKGWGTNPATKGDREKLLAMIMEAADEGKGGLTLPWRLVRGPQLWLAGLKYRVWPEGGASHISWL